MPAQKNINSILEDVNSYTVNILGLTRPDNVVLGGNINTPKVVFSNASIYIPSDWIDETAQMTEDELLKKTFNARAVAAMAFFYPAIHAMKPTFYTGQTPKGEQPYLGSPYLSLYGIGKAVEEDTVTFLEQQYGQKEGYNFDGIRKEITTDFTDLEVEGVKNAAKIARKGYEVTRRLQEKIATSDFRIGYPEAEFKILLAALNVARDSPNFDNVYLSLDEKDVESIFDMARMLVTIEPVDLTDINSLIGKLGDEFLGRRHVLRNFVYDLQRLPDVLDRAGAKPDLVQNSTRLYDFFSKGYQDEDVLDEINLDSDSRVPEEVGHLRTLITQVKDWSGKLNSKKGKRFFVGSQNLS